MITALIAACWLIGFAALAPAFSRDIRAETKEAARQETAGVSLTDPAKTDMTVAATSLKATGLDAIRAAASRLTPESLAKAAPEAERRADDWARAVADGGGVPIGAIGEILPSSTWFQARLVTRRDEPDMAYEAESAGEFGRAYSTILGTLPLTRASAESIEAVIGRIWRESGIAAGLKKEPAPVIKRSERWLPARSTLSSAHQYALDVFFTSVKRHGAAERGPVIMSISSGLVVAVAADWTGGDKPSSYQGGGLSPKAGNGAIIYDPDARRYYAYFHLSDVDVRPGQVVQAGEKIGRGGNTGVNARKKSHGGHVHIEIHDAEDGPWTSYSLRDLIVSLY